MNKNQAEGPISRLRRFIWRHWVLCLFLLVSAAFIMTPHALERSFVYFPMRELDGLPSDYGLPYQDLELRTDDGIRVHGWHVPYEGSRGTVLIFHGNAGNISHRLPWLQMLRDLGVSLVIIDYRGYGRSEGKPFEQGLYRDARAAYEWWRSTREGSGEKLILLGESLGGAVAVDLASTVPVDALILQSTFTSAWDMAKTILPLGLLQPIAGVDFDSVEKIHKVSCPKLFIHGSRDEIVPLRLGRRLYDRALEPKEFYEVPDAGHNDLIWAAGPDYLVRIRDFLSRLEATVQGDR